MKLTFYGHICFEIEIKGQKILFDPYISANALAKDVDIKTINPDFIFLSHGHSDHIGDTEEIVKQSNAQIVAIYEVANWLSNSGIKNIIPMNIGGKLKLSFAEIRMVSALHSSSMPDGSYGGNPAGFVIKTSDKSFYFAGDTALSYEMKLIGELYQIDFAILPIGGHFTMDTDDAVRAANFVGTQKVIAAHYDTFPPIKINLQKSIEIFQKNNIDLQFLTISQTIEL